MLYRFFFVFLFLFLCSAAANENETVTHVLNGKSFVLATGDTVRLASIEVPNRDQKPEGTHGAYIGEPFGEEATAALEKLLAGHKVHIEKIEARDRHNRVIAQVYLDNGIWVQGELLKQGWAMVYSFPDNSQAVIEKMLAIEKQARQAKRGIWAHPYFRVITPQETQEFIGRYRVVEGKVASVNNYHGHTYINFSDHWKGNFAVFISRKYTEAFAPLHLPSLVGKTIRVRGWITYHNAPNMDLTHPAQIEIE